MISLNGIIPITNRSVDDLFSGKIYIFILTSDRVRSQGFSHFPKFSIAPVIKLWNWLLLNIFYLI